VLRFITPLLQFSPDRLKAYPASRCEHSVWGKTFLVSPVGIAS